MYFRKNLRNIAVVTAAVSGLLLSSFGTFTAAHADEGVSPSVVSSGNWGAADSGLTWEYDSDSVLTVMCDKEPGQQCEIPSTGMTSGDYRVPWHKQRLGNKPIEKIVFKDAFDSDTQTRRFKLPEVSRGLFTRDSLSASGPIVDDANALIEVTEIEGSEYLDTSAVSSMNSMFWGMKSLPSLNVAGWDTTNVTDTEWMFAFTHNLNEITGIEDLSFPALQSAGFMFKYFGALKPGTVSWDLSGWGPEGGVSGWINSLSGMFQNAYAIKELNLQGLVGPKVTSLSMMFNSCNRLEKLDTTGWDTSGVKDMTYMFQAASSLEELDLSHWDTSSLKNLTNAFTATVALESLNLDGWDTSNVTDFTGMLNTSGPLSTLTLGEDTKLGADVTSDAIGPNFGPEWAKGVEGVVPEDIKDQLTGNWKQVEPASSDWVGPTFGNESLVARSLSGDGAGTYIWETTEPLAKSYTVTYNLNGGDNADDPAWSPSEQVGAEEFYLPAATPTRDGFKFTGWKYADNIYLPGVAFMMPEENVEFVAQWEAEDSGGTLPPAPGLVVERDWGRDRYGTNLEVLKDTYKAGQVLFVARGSEYPDALTAGPAVVAQDASLALTPTKALRSDLHSFLQKNKPSKIYVVGGTGAVSNNVMKQLSQIAPTERVSGIDRYATANAIQAKFFPKVPSGQAFVATGQAFPDALTASAAGGLVGAPVMLVRGTSAKTVPANITKALKAAGVTNVHVVGGTGAVNEGIKTGIAKAGFSVDRLRGADRYETNIAVDKYLGLSDVTGLWIATGADFPDALSAAVPAGHYGQRLVLSRANCIPGPVVPEWIHGSQSKVSKVTLVGGKGVLSSKVEALTPCVGK